ncbi:Dienelactone hydrolase and related enzyme [Fulvimarina pelagi HTCC2506]|uniref:Dienelactone hydrolase and related enzyme n=1 Tax=Fulvimarina pelagi HTCC2506 TaxID=314231 RepID=Q0G531_9HYPH|nr:dienelactone hydrolase family protein [Fulvimarina pelagi]EAU43233.1 Dienelactone hydrolase and related enzyme [Fulvimarina pelagi HTCC2506]
MTIRRQLLTTAVSVSIALIAGSAFAGEAVTYQADGADYEGYYAPASGEGGAAGMVLIIHDWDGLTDYERQRADMLAEMGYDAFAVDLFGAGNRPETVELRREATGALYDDRDAMRTRIMAGLAAARENSKADNTVVMGYCFGGAAVMEAARSGKADNIAGWAAFHGGLTTPEGQSYPDDTAPILILQGGADTSTPPSEAYDLVQTLEEQGITYGLHVYSGAPHAFTVMGSDRYQERADQKSWSVFQDFLSENLG